MKLKKIALVAEIVSSVAVVVTLIVLLIEIRGNTAAIQAATYNNVANAIPTTVDYVATDAELARIWRDGQAGDLLEPLGQARYFSLVTANMRRLENAFYQYQIGGIEESQWRPIENIIARNMSTAGHRHWWPTARDNYSAEFQSLVDELMSR